MFRAEIPLRAWDPSSLLVRPQRALRHSQGITVAGSWKSNKEFAKFQVLEPHNPAISKQQIRATQSQLVVVPGRLSRFRGCRRHAVVAILPTCHIANRMRTKMTMKSYSTVTCGAAAILAAATISLTSSPAQATAQFASQSGKPCAQCHEKPDGGPALTAFGKAFQANGNKVPTTPAK